jgi:hypothetical protein
MGKQVIHLQPIAMTPDAMKDLEQRGFIIRLAPGQHELPAKSGESLDETVYISAEALGPHKLIAATINATRFVWFGTHPGNEEFLLIGDESMKPLYLVVALCKAEDLATKIAGGELSAEDFVCLRVVYNDPQASFFTMVAGVPHGEAIGDGPGRPPSFYVTEPRDNDTDLTDFGGYELVIDN